MSEHANSRIRVGLENRARQRKPAVTFGAPPTQAEIEEHNRAAAPTPVTSVEKLTELALQSEAAHAGLTQLFDATASQIHEERESAIADLRHVGFSLAEAQNHPLAVGVLSNHVQATNNKRLETMAALIRAAAVAEASEPLFSSPAAMLQTSMLLNDKKRQYVESLKASGANELQAMAIKAKAEGDAPLASAILTVADALPEGMRKNLPPNFRSGLADHFMGAHHRAAQNALTVIKGRLRSAQLASNSFARTGRRSAESILSHGLQVNRERA